MNGSKQKTEKKLLAATLVGVAALAIAGAAGAATDTDTMTVTATVADSCDIIAGDLTFGAYDPIVANKTAHDDNDATIEVTCTDGLFATITLDNGLQPASGVRYMKHATLADKLEYHIYKDSYVTEWNATNVVTTTGTGVAQTFTAKGRIPAGQASAAKGAYSDTVTATVTF